MSLHYLVKLEMLIAHVLRIPLLPIVTKGNSRIYLTATMISKFARFESG